MVKGYERPDYLRMWLVSVDRKYDPLKPHEEMIARS